MNLLGFRVFGWRGGVMAILADFRIAGLDILIGARQPSKFTGLTRITSFCVHPFFEELWF
jgi:hypothetical protein